MKTRQSVQQFTICQIGESDAQLFVMGRSRRFFVFVFFFFFCLGFPLLFDYFQRHCVSFCVLVLFSGLFLFVLMCVYTTCSTYSVKGGGFCTTRNLPALFRGPKQTTVRDNHC